MHQNWSRINLLNMSTHKDALHHSHTQLSLPESGHSSFWRLLGAEPRTRCGWDCWAPVPPLPSRLWLKAGTKDSTVPTGSRPARPAEPRDNLQRMGKKRGSSTLLRSRLHPEGPGGPSEEPAYSLKVARSSGPAWHSQGEGGQIKWQERYIKWSSFNFLWFLFYSSFLVESIFHPLPPAVRL